jgi:hypothetical protein
LIWVKVRQVASLATVQAVRAGRAPQLLANLSMIEVSLIEANPSQIEVSLIEPTKPALHAFVLRFQTLDLLPSCALDGPSDGWQQSGQATGCSNRRAHLSCSK